jgi:hypothetical protein
MAIVLEKILTGLFYLPFLAIPLALLIGYAWAGARRNRARAAAPQRAEDRAL